MFHTPAQDSAACSLTTWILLFQGFTLPLTCVVALLFQLMECCVNALVTSFKETILAECPGMIKRNETESEYAGQAQLPSFISDRYTPDHIAASCLLLLQLPVLTFGKSFHLKYYS